MPTQVDYTDPTNTAVKPGWKTTEWWCQTVGDVLAFAMVSTPLWFPDPKYSWVSQVSAAALAILTRLGYYKRRMETKVGTAQAASDAIIGLANARAQIATASSPSPEKAV